MTINQELLNTLDALFRLRKSSDTTEKDVNKWTAEAYKVLEKAHKEANRILAAEHTRVTEPPPRYEDLKAQLEYAEEIIRRLLCCVVDFSGFEKELTREIAARYLLGDKTPAEFFRKRAEFLKAEKGEKP